MVQRIGLSLQLYFMTIICVLFISLAGVTYYFYNSGLMNGQHVATIYESSIWLEGLQKNNYISQISQQVKQSKDRTAYKIFDRLVAQTQDLNRVHALGDSFVDLKKNSDQVKKSFDSLVSYPEVKDIFSVFRKKLVKFQKFVISNRWRTLTRMSTRMLARIDKDNDNRWSTLKPLNRSVLQDITIMKNVTDGSTLSPDDKKLINLRLISLKKEMIMLRNFISDKKIFLNNYNKFEKSYGVWSKEIAPEISLARLSIGRKNKTFSLMLAALVLLALGFFVFGFYVYKGHQKQTQRIFESKVIEIINENLLPVSANTEIGSQKFQKQIIQLHEYLQKRMSFGAIFQDSIPFSSILLDSNLRLLWANPSFCDDWGIAKNLLEEDSLNWDYIYRFTNLGATDPVVDALQTGIAGIFQIQLKVKADQPSRPFEMYVSPVEHNGQKRIMVYFYPLSSMEQTIANQAKSIMAPITKTIDAMMQKNFNNEFTERARDEFFSAGIDHIFDKFQALDETLQIQRTGYHEKIDRLEDDLTIVTDALKSVGKIQTELSRVQGTFERTFLKLKNQMIDYVGSGREQTSLSLEIIQEMRSLEKEYVDLLGINYSMAEVLNAQQSSTEGLKKVRDIFKKISVSIEDARVKLQQSVDQALVFNRSDKIEKQRIEEALNKIKFNAKTVEQLVQHVGKTTRHLDVSLSKIEMLSSGNKLSDLEEKLHEKSNISKTMGSAIDSRISAQKSQMKTSSALEEQFVSEVKNIFHLSQSVKEQILGLDRYGLRAVPKKQQETQARV